MFRRFGSRVTIVDPVEHLMSREDPEISSALEDVFFFQADDGIRGGTVTGVQTCALPISHTLGELALIFQLEGLHVARERERGEDRSEEHTSELQSQFHLVCRLLLEK